MSSAAVMIGALRVKEILSAIPDKYRITLNKGPGCTAFTNTQVPYLITSYKELEALQS